MADVEDEKEFERLMMLRNLKCRVIRIVLIIAVILVVFATFMNYPELWVAAAGVIVIVAVSYWSEIQDTRDFEPSRPCSGRSVVITGCDTGFGHLLAQHLAKQGVVVFAGCLNAEGDDAASLKEHCGDNLHVLQMDVTNDKQIEDCVKYIETITDGEGLWGLVNNAGLNFLGDIELTTMSQFNLVTNINLLGVVRVTKAFLPLIRKQKGRIVNVTSVKGRLSESFNAAYSMTKFAGEAFSDILRMEMVKFGVKVCIIEPGNFGGATGCLNMNRIRADFESMWESLSKEQRELYGRAYIEQHIESIEQAIPSACFDLMLVIRAMEHALFSLKPKTRYLVPGGTSYDIYRWRIAIQPFLPTWLMDRWLLSDVTHFKLAKQSQSS